MGWRDHSPVHPAANLFPLMSELELRELGEDIKKRSGLVSPIVLHRGKLLDGRNRLDAMELVGITLDWNNFDNLSPIIHHTAKDDDPYGWVIAANLHRRHLTGEQKRELIAKILKAKPGESNRKIAKQTKADDKTVAKVRREMEGRSEIPNVETRTDTKGRGQPARRSRKQKMKERDFILAEVAAGRAGDACLIAMKAAEERPTGCAEVSIEERRAEHAALDDADDIVERCLSLIIAMTDQQRAQFFARYTEWSAARLTRTNAAD